MGLSMRKNDNILYYIEHILDKAGGNEEKEMGTPVNTQVLVATPPVNYANDGEDLDDSCYKKSEEDLGYYSDYFNISSSDITDIILEKVNRRYDINVDLIKEDLIKDFSKKVLYLANKITYSKSLIENWTYPTIETLKNIWHSFPHSFTEGENLFEFNRDALIDLFFFLNKEETDFMERYILHTYKENKTTFSTKDMLKTVWVFLFKKVLDYNVNFCTIENIEKSLKYYNIHSKDFQNSELINAFEIKVNKYFIDREDMEI